MKDLVPVSEGVEGETVLDRRLEAVTAQRDDLLAALKAIVADAAYQKLHGWPHFTSAPTEMEWKAESATKAWKLVHAAIAKAEGR